MTCDMRRYKKFICVVLLFIPYTLIVKKNRPIKISSVRLKSRKWSNDLLHQLTLRNLVCAVALEWSFNVAFSSWKPKHKIRTGTEKETESDKSVPGKVSTNNIYLVNSRTRLFHGLNLIITALIRTKFQR